MYDDDLLRHAEHDLPGIQEDDDTVQNGSCGDRVAVRSLDPPNIAVDGCLVCRATVSRTIELCAEHGSDTVAAMDPATFLDMLDWDLSPAREDCALTVLSALQQA